MTLSKFWADGVWGSHCGVAYNSHSVRACKIIDLISGWTKSTIGRQRGKGNLRLGKDLHNQRGFINLTWPSFVMRITVKNTEELCWHVGRMPGGWYGTEGENLCWSQTGNSAPWSYQWRLTPSGQTGYHHGSYFRVSKGFRITNSFADPSVYTIWMRNL